MKLITLAVLASLTGCTMYHRDANGVAKVDSYGIGVHGVDVLENSDLAAEALKARHVTVEKSPDGTLTITKGAYPYGMPVNVPYDPFLRAQAAAAEAERAMYAELWGIAPKGGANSVLMARTSAPGTSLTASDIAVDASATCPKERAPSTVAESLACQKGDLDYFTDIVETNPAVR